MDGRFFLVIAVPLACSVRPANKRHPCPLPNSAVDRRNNGPLRLLFEPELLLCEPGNVSTDRERRGGRRRGGVENMDHAFGLDDPEIVYQPPVGLDGLSAYARVTSDQIVRSNFGNQSPSRSGIGLFAQRSPALG